MALGRILSAVFAAIMMIVHAINPVQAAKDTKDANDTPLGASGLPVPRYVSLKSDHVNVRGGPTKDNDVAWVYTRSGLPVEITAEYENWRRVRDSEGGPTKDNDVAWVYTRSGLPVEITAEYENWRRVRDSEGAEGWVYHSLLSGRRTAVVTMKSKDEYTPIYDDPAATSAVAAKLQAGVVANVKRCNNGWCRVIGTGFDGWIEQQRLWGVYADEKVN